MNAVSHLPGTAAPLTASDGFTAYSVRTRSGPHVTMQATTRLAGRLWTTTSRRSLKARSVAAHGVASALDVTDRTGTSPAGHSLVEVVSGATTVVDPLRPDLCDDAIGSLLQAPAVLRLAGAQAAQLLGYLEAATAIPESWLPHKRILLVTRLERSITLDDFAVVDATGTWADAAGRARLAPTAGVPDGHLPPLPTPFRTLVGTDRPCRVAVSTVDGPVALPARWRGGDHFDVSAAALDAIGALLPGLAAASFDDSASRRPDRKRGVMFRGAATLVDRDVDRATLAMSTDKITTWDGFQAQTFAPSTVGMR